MTTLFAALLPDVGAVKVPSNRVSVKPGGRVPVHSTPLADEAVTMPRFEPQVGPPPMTHPDAAGKVRMMAVIANWLEAGLVTVTENELAAQDASQ
jgi:hypothetical protein